jgi:Uma2 family endonuclease
LTPLRITVDEYDRIIASGSLNDPKRVELIDGYMVTKLAKSPEHSFSTKEALKALDRLLPPGRTSRKEEPVRIAPYDEPEPDISVVRGYDADFRHRLPEVRAA